jgi:hypothetical protein
MEATKAGDAELGSPALILVHLVGGVNETGPMILQWRAQELATT